LHCKSYNLFKNRISSEDFEYLVIEVLAQMVGPFIDKAIGTNRLIIAF